MEKIEQNKSRLATYHSKVNWLVFGFVSFFTLGAWLDINGLWCELPVMVHELPEGWKLPSILSAATQIAQIAPISFLIGRHFFPKYVTYVSAIYIILGIGCTACLLLSFFWNKTAYIFGGQRSVGLIVLNFLLAFVDGTSSVTFLPYIGSNFIKEYIIPNYIGESLAALIPACLSLAQGLGQSPGCHNVTRAVNSTTNVTTLEAIDIIPNYSVSVYFILLFILLFISTVSFTMLNFCSVSKRCRINSKNVVNNEPKNKVNPDDCHMISSSNEDIEFKEPCCSNMSKKRIVRESETALLSDDFNKSKDDSEKLILLSIILCVSFICYGVLPGLQSYSTLPYGNDVFNYAVNLSFMFLPIAIFLSIWAYEVSVIQIIVEFSVAVALAVYILVLSIMSPCPPFLGPVGATLSILSWILVQSMFMRVRCLVATRLQRFGETTLLILGACTMIGQIFGGLIVYLVVNIFNLLMDKDPCVTAESICNK
jgi:riboflavin transporter 2